jgi:hypothetical protein
VSQTSLLYHKYFFFSSSGKTYIIVVKYRYGNRNDDGNTGGQGSCPGN